MNQTLALPEESIMSSADKPATKNQTKSSLKFNVDRDVLEEALSVIVSSLNSLPTLPILGHVLVQSHENRLVITGSDLTLSVEANISAEILSDGITTVPGKSILNYIKTLPKGNINFEQSAKNVRVISGRSRLDLPQFNPEDYPKVSFVPVSMSVPASVLSLAIKQTRKSIGTDTTRPILNGIHFIIDGNKITAASSDCRRLHVSDHTIQSSNQKNEKSEIVVPSEAIDPLLKILSVSGQKEIGSNVFIGLNQSSFTVQYGAYLFHTRSVDGQYPDYEKIIPKSFQNIALVDKDQLMSAIKRARLADNKTSKIVLSVSNNELRLHSAGDNTIESEDVLDVTYSGEPLQMGVNSSFLLDTLESVSGKTVRFKLNQPADPISVTESDSNTFNAIIMPIRLN